MTEEELNRAIGILRSLPRQLLAFAAVVAALRFDRRTFRTLADFVAAMQEVDPHLVSAFAKLLGCLPTDILAAVMPVRELQEELTQDDIVALRRLMEEEDIQFLQSLETKEVDSE